MGAYSSWGMLAMFHHCIVQYCHWSTGGTKWYSDYAIVGDDLAIINNGHIARRYREVMAVLGTEIGLAKSIESPNGVIEFVKQLVWRSDNLSGVPLKMLVSGVTLTNRLANLEFFRKRGWIKTRGDAVRVLAIGRNELRSFRNLGWKSSSSRLLALLQAARLDSRRLAGSIEDLIRLPIKWAGEVLELYKSDTVGVAPTPAPKARVSPMTMRIEGALRSRLVDAVIKFTKSVPWLRGRREEQGGIYTPTDLRLLSLSSELDAILNATPREWNSRSYEETRKLLAPYLSGIFEILEPGKPGRDLVTLDNLSVIKWIRAEFNLKRAATNQRIPKWYKGETAGKMYKFPVAPKREKPRKPKSNLRVTKPSASKTTRKS